MKWENLAINELEFYKNRYENLQKIKDSIEELEERFYHFPVSYVNDDLGKICVSGASVENQVIRKVDTENALKNMAQRIYTRCNRIESALLKLEEDEREIIDYVYIDDCPLSFAKIGHILGYRSAKEFNRKVRQSLMKFYRFILIQKMTVRQEKRKEYNLTLADDMRRQRVRF